jgi:hypothetical protein
MSALACLVAIGFTHASLVAAEPDPTGTPGPKGEDSFYLLWYLDGVWHLDGRGTPGRDVKFIGSVRVEGDLVTGKLNGVEASQNQEGVIVHRDGRGFDFQFIIRGKGRDGLDFKTGPKATAVAFKLLIDGVEAPTRIRIGQKSQNPTAASFTLPVPRPLVK